MFTLSLNSLPALNTGTVDAGIVIVSLVLGFLPSLAALSLTSKVPNPTKDIFPSSTKEVSIPSKTEFKAIFSVKSLEQFDREQFTIMPTAEYMQLTDKLSQVETELAELVEYKQQREKADFETKRQAIIDEYSKLLDSEVVEKLANEHKEDLVQLDYALALAVKEEMKNFKQQIGIRIPNDKTFSKSEEKKPKGLAL